MPTAKIYQYFGKDRFDEMPCKPRKFVGEVEADNLEEAFFKAQNDRPEYGKYGWSTAAPGVATSCCMGDVIEFQDEFYLVLRQGFTKIISPTGL